MTIDEELATYLNDVGFSRFIDAWISKYQSHGYFAGKISLSNLSEQEKLCLSGFLGCDLSQGELKITYYQFEQKLKATRFENADFLNAIEILKKEKIYSKKQIRALHDQKFNQFKNAILKKLKDSKAYNWLDNYFLTDSFARRYFENDQIRYYNIINNVCNALNNLPVYVQSFELLALFAQQITKDPHYFDEDLARDLLLKGICFEFNLTLETKSSEEIAKVLYQAGILKDELSNYCYICHLLPNGDHPSWQGFYDEYEPWNINFYNIKKIKENFITSPIFIVENPSVFRILCDYIKEFQLNIGLVSSNGQINLCTYYLLDKLVLSGCHLYYTGDYDPEGLVIADKLKHKYQDNLTLQSYDEKLFDKIKIFQIEISEKRLQMLNTLSADELVKIANVIRATRSFGYQEGLVDSYKEAIVNITDIKDYFK